MYYDYEPQTGNPDPIQSGGQPVQPNLVLARAYVPDQPYTRIFAPEEALRQGTLFPDLVRPYEKRR